jgi:CheY-like chemotaxis protein
MAHPCVLIVTPSCAVSTMLQLLVNSLLPAATTAVCMRGSDVQAAQASQPALLVIVDDQVRGPDGLALVRQLRAHGETCSILVLASWRQTVARAAAAGATACIDKLASPRECFQVLSRLCGPSDLAS